MPILELIPAVRHLARNSGTLLSRFGITARGLATSATGVEAKEKIKIFNTAVLTKHAEEIADDKIAAAAGDFETTGKKKIDDPTGLRILEAALAPIATSAAGSDYYQYYNPMEPVEPGLLEFHGIKAIGEFPTFKQDWPKFRQHLQKADVLVLHNTPGVDSRAMASELMRVHPRVWPKIPLICSQAMSMLLPPALTEDHGPYPQLSLKKLAEIFDVDPDGPWHSAKTDAKVLATLVPDMAEAVARAQQHRASELALARYELAEMSGEDIIAELQLANPKLVNAHGTTLALSQFGLYGKLHVRARTTEDVEPGPMFDSREASVSC